MIGAAANEDCKTKTSCHKEAAPTNQDAVIFCMTGSTVDQWKYSTRPKKSNACRLSQIPEIVAKAFLLSQRPPKPLAACIFYS